MVGGMGNWGWASFPGRASDIDPEEDQPQVLGQVLGILHLQIRNLAQDPLHSGHMCAPLSEVAGDIGMTGLRDDRTDQRSRICGGDLLLEPLVELLERVGAV